MPPGEFAGRHFYVYRTASSSARLFGLESPEIPVQLCVRQWLCVVHLPNQWLGTTDIVTLDPASTSISTGTSVVDPNGSGVPVLRA